jgi:hypothetical protein
MAVTALAGRQRGTQRPTAEILKSSIASSGPISRLRAGTRHNIAKKTTLKTGRKNSNTVSEGRLASRILFSVQARPIQRKGIATPAIVSKNLASESENVSKGATRSIGSQ